MHGDENLCNTLSAIIRKSCHKNSVHYALQVTVVFLPTPVYIISQSEYICNICPLSLIYEFTSII